MLKATATPGEPGRLSALRALEILDTPPEERFDRITRLAVSLFRVPIALVSLVDADRQWFKSCQGLDATQTDRDISFCGHAIREQDIFYIRDARRDARFADNPLVTGPPHIRFYAGAPVGRRDGGGALGTLCIIDRRPRRLSRDELALLRDLADWVDHELNVIKLEKMERHFRKLSQLHQAILDSADYAVIATDPRGLIRTFNRTAEQWLDYRAAEVVGRVSPLLFHDPGEVCLNSTELESRLGAPVPPGFQTLVAGVSGSLGRQREWTYVRRDGSCFPVSLSVTALAEETGGGYLFVADDISERRQMEQAKDEFIATVSHELRTPLTSVCGALRLLAGGAVGPLPARAGELVEIAERNSEHLVHLVNDILDIEKIELDRMPYDIQRLPLLPLLRQSLDSMQSLAGARGVGLALAEPPGDATVAVDPLRLVQVLNNLLSNGIKYSPAGATVTVAVQRRESAVRVTVTDQGPGVPDEFRGRIFQKFALADASDTRHRGGTGLGLSIAKAIVERLGGGIGYQSAPGAGSTFYFELPVCAVEPVC